jgi:crotonobetainyl-CoA:carnitine CoA-transferase CaiB-like acyl-CoA transferase
MRLPLAGVRIVTLEQFGAGPFGSMNLADMGAEVIKLENPATGGDASRSMGPHFLGEHDSEYFQSLNYNKRSVTLNLKTPEGQAILHRLIPKVDAIMNNLRGNQPTALGIDYASLETVNPKIVCGHLSAYGRDNDRADWPGYDYLMQAEAGFLSVTGEPGTPPARFGLSIIDFMTGITMAFGLLAGLYDSARTGKGRDVDVSLFDVALGNLTYPGSWFLNSGTVTGRAPRGAHPTATPVQLVKTADGWLFLMCMMDKFWELFVTAIGSPDWAAEERFSSMKARRENRDELTVKLDAAGSEYPTEYWIKALSGQVPVAPVYDIQQALDNPFVHQIGMVQTSPHPEKPNYRAISNPIKLDGERVVEDVCAPLGADTNAVLNELGYLDGEIAALRQNGIV